MAGSVNKVTLIGNLGRDPEVRFSQSGDKIANISIATSESWKDKKTGEKREKTEWHRVVCYSKGLIGIIKQVIAIYSKLTIKLNLYFSFYHFV